MLARNSNKAVVFEITHCQRAAHWARDLKPPVDLIAQDVYDERIVSVAWMTATIKRRTLPTVKLKRRHSNK